MLITPGSLRLPLEGATRCPILQQGSDTVRPAAPGSWLQLDLWLTSLRSWSTTPNTLGSSVPGMHTRNSYFVLCRQRSEEETRRLNDRPHI